MSYKVLLHTQDSKDAPPRGQVEAGGRGENKETSGLTPNLLTPNLLSHKGSAYVPVRLFNYGYK